MSDYQERIAKALDGTIHSLSGRADTETLRDVAATCERDGYKVAPAQLRDLADFLDALPLKIERALRAAANEEIIEINEDGKVHRAGGFEAGLEELEKP